MVTSEPEITSILPALGVNPKELNTYGCAPASISFLTWLTKAIATLGVLVVQTNVAAVLPGTPTANAFHLHYCAALKNVCLRLEIR